jgi:hypothetical protein
MGCDIGIKMRMDMDMRGPSGVESFGSSRELGCGFNLKSLYVRQIY